MPSVPRCCRTFNAQRWWISIPDFCSSGLLVGSSTCPTMICTSLLAKVLDDAEEKFPMIARAGFTPGPQFVWNAGPIFSTHVARLSRRSLLGIPPTGLSIAMKLTKTQSEWRFWSFPVCRGSVASTPEMYQAYIQRSRGEFSCAKPSYVKLQTSWISDRTLCYLASGKPVVVQHTGPSSFLPNGEGMFRFSTLQEAADALELINADYRRHSQAARQIAETYFDTKQVVTNILTHALR